MASLYIQIHSNKKTWSLREQRYKNGVSSQPIIPKSVYQSLGIDPNWSIERAKERVKEINSMNSIERERLRAVTAATKRVHKSEQVVSIFLPTHYIKDFEDMLTRNNMGSSKHLKTRLVMWGTAKKIIAKVMVEPRMYSEYFKVFYNEFKAKSYSPDYIMKLIGLINQWGSFVSRKNNLYFEPIPKPISRELNQLERSYRTSPICREHGSTRLTPELLEALRPKLKLEHYEWLYVSVWFGLRPDEIETAKFEVYHDKVYNVDVLKIWQPKVLEYKYIPILHAEQRQALSWLRPIKRPLNKTLQLHSGDSRLTVYGGRKGFQDLMRRLGEVKVDISRWLGHTSLRTTEDYYEKKDEVTLSRKI